MNCINDSRREQFQQLSPVMRKCTNNGHEKCTTFERHSS